MGDKSADEARAEREIARAADEARAERNSKHAIKAWERCVTKTLKHVRARLAALTISRTYAMRAARVAAEKKAQDAVNVHTVEDEGDNDSMDSGDSRDKILEQIPFQMDFSKRIPITLDMMARLNAAIEWRANQGDFECVACTGKHGSGVGCPFGAHSLPGRQHRKCFMCMSTANQRQSEDEIRSLIVRHHKSTQMIPKSSKLLSEAEYSRLSEAVITAMVPILDNMIEPKFKQAAEDTAAAMGNMSSDIRAYMDNTQRVNRREVQVDHDALEAQVIGVRHDIGELQQKQGAHAAFLEELETLEQRMQDLESSGHGGGEKAINQVKGIINAQKDELRALHESGATMSRGIADLAASLRTNEQHTASEKQDIAALQRSVSSNRGKVNVLLKQFRALVGMGSSLGDNVKAKKLEQHLGEANFWDRLNKNSKDGPQMEQTAGRIKHVSIVFMTKKRFVELGGVKRDYKSHFLKICSGYGSGDDENAFVTDNLYALETGFDVITKAERSTRARMFMSRRQFAEENARLREANAQLRNMVGSLADGVRARGQTNQLVSAWWVRSSKCGF